MHPGLQNLRHVQQWFMEEDAALDVREGMSDDGEAGDTLHREHLRLLRNILDRKACGTLSDDAYLTVIGEFERAIRTDGEIFDRQVKTRPQLVGVAAAWKAENGRMLRAYAEMRRFVVDRDGAHLERAYVLIERSLSARAPLYAAFEN